MLSLMQFKGNGSFNSKCQKFLKQKTQCDSIYLMSSCTHALEMAAILLNIQQGDEVIMPSYTFSSTANAFVLRGAKIQFIDIVPETMNLDVNLIEEAINENTKAIVPMHYAGVSCDMDKLLKIASDHNLAVVEDSAQCIGAKYKGKSLGTMGDFGCYSFHATKNIHCGEGGALFVNNPSFIERSELIREKGTNRNKFLKGEVDKYTWVDIGSSYLLSEINAAFLYAQLQKEQLVTSRRLKIWKKYNEGLSNLQTEGKIELPHIPDYNSPNGHIFFIKTKDINERTKLSNHLKKLDINASFHYIPLHSAKAGIRYGEFVGEDKYTTLESKRLLRLPVYMSLSDVKVDRVIQSIIDFYNF